MSSNNKEPLVSIAIITYNQKEFLKECIESCLAQDYPNLEIVVADDGSTDGTHELLCNYAEKYPGKFVLRLSKHNVGITNNSNSALAACSGEFIAWMGGDDLMLPGKLHKQVEFMLKHPECTICYHDLDVFESESDKSLYRFSDLNKPREGGVEVVARYGTFNGACSTFVRMASVKNVKFNTSLPVASDWYYWFQVMLSGGRVCYLNEVLGRYRRHSLNVTRKINKVTPNTLDHMTTCCMILNDRPDLLRHVFFALTTNLRSNRHVFPYFDALSIRLRYAFDYKALFALVIYILTFGRWKV